ncbi:methyl-accepting chemotaxis protein [Asticcacaulis machinosus]|uniref:Methyl-accepting chemotaxis protein n=1 Tax=Asticcacaulis machinosus TaxID=2984211 RepID=A0ABT5HG74_9CAUL|nr:methyl-accepting chemotaxis protein [Asticcacaulis machinosus]MDC7675231.1 methyl-accepting chemotaxis protein [Asticcacaulis machinosus]
MFSRSLSAKIAGAGALTVAVVFGLGTLFISQQTNTTLSSQNQNLQTQAAENQAARVQNRLDLAARTAQETVTALSAIRQQGVTDRAVYDGVLKAGLETNPDLLGVWSGWEPNALDGKDAEFANTPTNDATGRFVPYWNRGSGQAIREPLVDYDKPGAGDYYLLPKQQDRMIAIEPYSYTVGGKNMLIMTFSAPIKVDGQFYGTGGVDIALDTLNKEIAAVKPFGTGFVTLVSHSGIAVSYPDEAKTGKLMKDVDPAAARAAADAIAGNKAATIDAAGTGGDWRYLALPVSAGGTKDRWAVVVAVPVATLNAEANKNNTTMLTLSALSIVIAALILFFVLSRLVGSPLKGLGKTFDRMASGDHNAEVPEAKRIDEIGLIGKAVMGFRESLRLKARADADEDTRRQAQASEERKVVMARLAQEFEAAVGGIVETVSQASRDMKNSAEALNMIAANASGQTITIASATEEAASNVRTVAAASEELTASINEITSKAQQSGAIARKAVEEANKSDARIQELESAASKVGEVINFIQAIAQQTNLLALNATIEAARAGDAGKGFAVVATEVKSLASQTAKATDDISEQIDAIQNATRGTVEAIHAIRDVIHDMSDIALAISAAMEQQGAATDDIARNVHEASKGTDEVASHIHSISVATQETGDASSQVLETADNLVTQSDSLRQQVQQFVAQVRHG